MRDARGTIDRLLKGWDPALVDSAFDRQSLRYPWFANLRSDLDQLSRAHGACHAGTEPNALDGSQASWRVRCERGEIQFSLALTPSAAARIQSISWKEEFPPDEKSVEVAARLAGVVGKWSEKLAQGLFATDEAQRKAKVFLARLGAKHGTCDVDRPISSDGQGAATFRLQCAMSPADLVFRIDEKSGLVTDVTGGPPQDVKATCWEQPRLTE